jgi:hypothetical protein
MTDRELLEAAARAAGFTVTWDGDNPPYPRATTDGHWNPCWNPLDRDGDALRLAVKLRIDLHTSPINGDAVIVTAKHRLRSDLLRQPNPTQAAEPYAPDPDAETRRAIVRAAAAIGAQE